MLRVAKDQREEIDAEDRSRRLASGDQASFAQAHVQAPRLALHIAAMMVLSMIMTSRAFLRMTESL